MDYNSFTPGCYTDRFHVDHHAGDIATSPVDHHASGIATSVDHHAGDIATSPVDHHASDIVTSLVYKLLCSNNYTQHDIQRNHYKLLIISLTSIIVIVYFLGSIQYRNYVRYTGS